MTSTIVRPIAAEARRLFVVGSLFLLGRRYALLPGLYRPCFCFSACCGLPLPGYCCLLSPQPTTLRAQGPSSGAAQPPFLRRGRRQTRLDGGIWIFNPLGLQKRPRPCAYGPKGPNARDRGRAHTVTRYHSTRVLGTQYSQYPDIVPSTVHNDTGAHSQDLPCGRTICAPPRPQHPGHVCGDARSELEIG